MDIKLEVVVIPVSDVNRAKTFYADDVGFNVDEDVRLAEDYRVVQMTPPGSACSITVQTRRPPASPEMPPGSLQGLQLTTSDLPATRAELAGRGVDISEVQVIEAAELRPPREGEALDYVGFAFFSDPDGNGWAIQQMPERNDLVTIRSVR